MNSTALQTQIDLAMKILTLTRRVLLSLLLLGGVCAWAEEAPDQFIKRLTTDLLDTVKNDASLKSGDVQRLSQLVDQKIMPHLNFQRMTASAVGPGWRQASPEQQKRLQDGQIRKTDPLHFDTPSLHRYKAGFWSQAQH